MSCTSCDCINPAIADITAIWDSLNQSNTDFQTAISAALGDLLVVDNQGGGYPSTPPTSTAIAGRITYLQNKNPAPPASLITAWQILKRMTDAQVEYVASLAVVTAKMGSWKQLGAANSCG